jgi:long-chain acyl-CoA synthetase
VRTPLEHFDAAVDRLGGAPLLFAFETPLAADRCRELVDGLAAGMAGLGVGRGDRVALLLQNDPQFVLAMLAIWRLGAIAVPCNPMLRERELTHHLGDAGATALVALDVLHHDVARAALPRTDVRVVLTTGAQDLRDGHGPTPAAADVHDLLTLAVAHAGTAPPTVEVGAQDVAVLTYTSGTTGPPKGAMNTHGNIAFASDVYRELLAVDGDDVILGIAPLFHVTGLTAHIGLGLSSGAPTVLAHRFDPVVAARLTELHHASVTVAAITAYIAMATSEGARAHDLSSLTRAYSGGAPIAPATVADVEARLGVRVRPVYGLTETTGPTHVAPSDRPTPTHPETGALAVGLAAPRTTTRILGEDGSPAGPGELGEIAIRGPQVVPGYWGQPEESAAAIREGELRTGDIGLIDDEGWLYVVDRKKDLIVASGFKVWPREVEDVLYEHPAVHEAAVVGVPDSYRGETVWAYVSLRAGAAAGEDELVRHCRERLAAYKAPRAVHVLDALPKTASGKILRLDLRKRAIRPGGAGLP